MKIKKLSLIATLLLGRLVFASPITMDVLSAPQGLTINNGQAVLTLPSQQFSAAEQVLTQSATQNVSNKSFIDAASNVSKEVYALYDFGTLGGATNADLDLGVNIPAKSVMQSAFADVITAPLGGSTSSIGFSVGDGGVSATNSSGNLSNIVLVGNYSVGQYQLKMRGISSWNTGSFPMVKITNASKVYANLRGGALTAGKIAIYIRYLISQ